MIFSKIILTLILATVNLYASSGFLPYSDTIIIDGEPRLVSITQEYIQLPDGTTRLFQHVYNTYKSTWEAYKMQNSSFLTIDSIVILPDAFKDFENGVYQNRRESGRSFYIWKSTSDEIPEELTSEYLKFVTFRKKLNDILKKMTVCVTTITLTLSDN